MQRIARAIENTQKIKGQEYIDAFVNRRSGSKWSSKVKSLADLVSLDWQEIQAHPSLRMEWCSYFRATTKSVLGLGLLNVADLRNYPHPVDFNEGEHGLELVGSKIFKAQKTKEAHLILGDCCGKEIIYTAFPGQLFCSIKKFPGKNIQELRGLDIPFAVKACPTTWINFQASKQKINLENAVLIGGESFTEELPNYSLNYGNLLNWRDTDLDEVIKTEVCESLTVFFRENADTSKHHVLLRTEEKVFDLAVETAKTLLPHLSILYVSSDWEAFLISESKHRNEVRSQISTWRNYKN
jgi:hypothetical protein